MGVGRKRGQVRPELSSRDTLLHLRLKLFLSHLIPSQCFSLLLQFSIVKSSFLSDMASSSPSVYFWPKGDHFVGPRSRKYRSIFAISPTFFPSFLSPHVQDILSLIAETDQECDLRPVASVGQVEKVLSGNSGRPSGYPCPRPTVHRRPQRHVSLFSCQLPSIGGYHRSMPPGRSR